MDNKLPLNTSNKSIPVAFDSASKVNKLAATPYLDSVTRQRLWLALSVIKENQRLKEGATIH